VIDPHLKWKIRRKLKQIHRELKLTFLYVTHDQVEALTFADQVLVMSRGQVLQIGSAEDLFERPAHTFVGHFIGSPGMNFIPAKNDGVTLAFLGKRFSSAGNVPTGDVTIGIRPEYVGVMTANAVGTVDFQVSRVQDIGTYFSLTCVAGGVTVKIRMSSQLTIPQTGDVVGLDLNNSRTCYYQNEGLVL